MHLSRWATDIVAASRQAVQQQWEQAAEVRRVNQWRVLEAFRAAHVSEMHLTGTTGYGYNDPAREALEQVYARIFGTEAALVRPQVVSGTQAISATLFGLCRPGDDILSATGAPYDTLQRVIKGPGRCLQDWGITYHEVPLAAGVSIDTEAVIRRIKKQTKVVMFQRSRGYTLRPGLSPTAIGAAVQAVKAQFPQVICFVDNCYGEFVESVEPTHFGVDILAGSLIKNPGGTLAPSGGYIVGRKDLVAQVADVITAPGLGTKVGPMLGLGRSLLQGLYLAPLLVHEAVCGAILAAHVYEKVGYPVYPRWNEPRTDTVQAITLGSAAAILAFCRSIQSASPVDSMAIPEADDLPGYADPIVMAAGTFVQGASSELSADAPLRSPYTVFLQGGVSRDQVEMAIALALDNLAAGQHLPDKVYAE